ncbi:hypothetical protein G6F50_015334 [Rhizopus delemar]|uniref:Uncharacterized protein n=1 Tax=Rhizopus delemar TaxID=936053 RepID=A0A9P6XZF4_9FUNG|nr:hypothetical protein G6F24_018318 [Rhizopus arrhizus]KAG1535331.1 hypothetical protein G6F50_015334 [Rhizopus delemar]
MVCGYRLAGAGNAGGAGNRQPRVLRGVRGHPAGAPRAGQALAGDLRVAGQWRCRRTADQLLVRCAGRARGRGRWHLGTRPGYGQGAGAVAGQGADRQSAAVDPRAAAPAFLFAARRP